MPLELNSKAPNFTAPCTVGKDFILEDYKNIPLILYFYPKNFTLGCTKEACGFRDEFEYFRGFEIPIFGISRDKLSSHHKFKKEKNLPFDLISDSKNIVIPLYKANYGLFNLPKRITYLLDKDHKIKYIVDSDFGINKHIQQIKKIIQESPHL